MQTIVYHNVIGDGNNEDMESDEVSELATNDLAGLQIDEQTEA